MAERRMFTNKITESDAFLEMPLSSQSLYFHLCMNADDDGFVKNPKRICRMVGCNEDDLNILIAKSFVITYDSTGVIVIKHWRMHNLLRKDRYKPTEYLEERSMLYLKDNGSYTLNKDKGKPILSGLTERGNQVTTEWQPNGNQMAPQVRLGKDSIGKDNKEKEKEKTTRHKYGEYNHVLLSDEQYSRLVNEYGLKLVTEYIRKMDEYCQLHGKSYKDYNLAIRNWLGKDNQRPVAKKTPESSIKEEEHELTDEEWVSMMEATYGKQE